MAVSSILPSLLIWWRLLRVTMLVAAHQQRDPPAGVKELLLWNKIILHPDGNTNFSISVFS